MTAIGRTKRDYVWIMARTPTIPAEQLEPIVDFLVSQGYDSSKIQRVPQQTNRTIVDLKLEN